MARAASDFFEVNLIGEVTVVKLLHAAEYRRDRSKETDLRPLIHRMRGLPPPPEIDVLEQFRDDLCALLETNKPAKVVLDFAGLHQIGHENLISPEMYGVYSTAKKLSASFGCQWRICGLIEIARSYYDLTSLHVIFPLIHDGPLDAIAAFAAQIPPA